MASLDTSLVDHELKRIIRTSQAIKKLTARVLEQIEEDPSSFKKLDEIPRALREIEHLTEIRKAYITHRKHDFRLIFAHWTFEDGAEHVDVLLAFPRKAGYSIDWEQVEEWLRG
jgi:hypothetical protein